MGSAYLDDYNKEGIYLTEKLQKQMRKLQSFPITIVEAPTGFGKTTSIKDFSQRSTDKIKWINITGSSKEIFWADFCDAFSEINEVVERSLRTIEYPQSEKAIVEIRNILKKLTINESTYLIIDNYHLIGDSFFDMLIESLIDVLPQDLHFIFITQALTSTVTYDLILKKKLLHISKEDMEFKDEDIIRFFERHHLSISQEEAKSLYEFSEGWISAIYLQMIHFAESGSLDNCSSIDTLVERTVWDKLSDSEKYFMISLSSLDNFTVKEAKMLLPKDIPVTEIENILKKVIFIRFDKSNRNYYIHHIFSDYLNSEFRSLSKEDRREIIVQIGKLHEHRNMIFKAYSYYYQAEEWELIYQSVPPFDSLYPYINRENKEFFIGLVNNCPDEIREKYYYFPIIMCFVLFMYNEKDRLIEYLMNIVYAIEENETLSERQKKNLLGTVYYVRGYTEFNNIPMMNEFYKKSLDYAGSPIIDLTAKVPFTFGCPSVLHIFHKTGELADTQIQELSEGMPNYYRLSEGHGKGADALMKAEVLYNRGDIEGAEILCHKALYMADSREQTCITLSALLLLTRMSVFEGDYDTYSENLNSFKKKVNYNNSAIMSEYINMIDLSESFMYALTDHPDKISQWLTDWESIENRVNLISMSFANIIFAKWLYLKEDYQKFLGISGQFLGVSSIFKNAMPNIYTYIFIAMSNNALGYEDKAVKMLRFALDMARPDDFIMPFVENEQYLSGILEEANYDVELRPFIKKIKSLAKKYNNGLKSIQKNAKNKDNFGLTSRELEVAKLASERYSNKEIGEKLFIAESTVKSNLKIIFNKLNVNSRSELSNFFK